MTTEEAVIVWQREGQWLHRGVGSECREKEVKQRSIEDVFGDRIELIR